MKLTDAMLQYGPQEKQISSTFAQFEGLMGVFDAASDQRIALIASENPSCSVCLYNGKAAKNLQFAAPYIFDFRENKPLQSIMLSLTWGENCGLWMQANYSLEELKQVLRANHLVELPDSRKVYFRFFDPRVFPTFIKSLDSQDLRSFATGIKRFLCESKTGEHVLSFEISKSKLMKTKIEVQGA